MPRPTSDDHVANDPNRPREVLGSLHLDAGSGPGNGHQGTQEITIARARRSDLEEIVALLTDDVLGKDRESDAADARYLEAFTAIDGDPNQVLLVALADERAIAATAQITFIPGLSRGGALRGQIEAVRVAASHRGQGLGRAFFEWMIDYCTQRGAAMVQLTTDKRRQDAIRFYERLGFVASHEGMKLALPH